MRNKKSQNSGRQLSVLRNGKNGVVQQPLVLRQEAVCWGIPMDELCYSLWFSNFLHLPLMPWDNVSVTMSTYLPEARNAIHNSFLKMKSVNWLVMLDSDVLPPPDFLPRLMAHNVPIVGGWYRKKGGNTEPVVYNFNPKAVAPHQWNIRSEPGQGLEIVDGIGAGLLLMRRDLAEAIGENPYSMARGGEDFELCLKVKEAGYSIRVDWSIAAAHCGVSYV